MTPLGFRSNRRERPREMGDTLRRGGGVNSGRGCRGTAMSTGSCGHQELDKAPTALGARCRGAGPCGHLTAPLRD